MGGSLENGKAGIGLAGVSTGIGAFGAYREADAANKAADFNAREYQIQADQARTRGEFDLALLRRENRQNLSALAQQVSNSGVETGSGSAVQLLAGQKGLDEKSEQVQKYNTEVTATGYERQAAMTKAAKRNPWAAAGKSLLAGAIQINNQYDRYRMYTEAEKNNKDKLNNQSLGNQSSGFWF